MNIRARAGRVRSNVIYRRDVSRNRVVRKKSANTNLWICWWVAGSGLNVVWHIAPYWAVIEVITPQGTN